ncbi:MAG: hypothetical protein A7315_02515 [Candidatus Altiarchaeales archaeon WOR_SM1_79]|nr:MAG: hypothetical protein A7315_02515 [Candidatus Altiarchaeales archaeon WOR_SM1_79]
MKIGIVQPYFLPYIGYFALINAVDKFVYLDDVQYIRRGWVNRNRIKLVDNWHYINLPVKKVSLLDNINTVYVVNNEKEINKIKKSVERSYRKAPYYNEVKELIFDLIIPDENISRLNIALTDKICNYLDFNTKMYVSSEIKKDNSLKGESLIINICKILCGDHYINPIGGMELYSKEKFSKHGIKLNFIKMNELVYHQGKSDFIPDLSIIDVLMWNSKEDIKNMLNNYTLV